MEYTPRVSPSDFSAQTSQTGGSTGQPAGVYGDPIVGFVRFNLADAGDLALVNAGTPKEIEFYNALALFPPISGTTEVPIPLPRLTAFTLLLSQVFGDTTYLYDECAEISLCNADRADNDRTFPLAHSWLWAKTDTSDLADICPWMRSEQVLMGYEGPAIVPRFTLRPGLIPGQSAADADLWYCFLLVPLARANLSEARITVPSPCCVPPFMPVGALKGTHLFSQHATPALTLPSPQPLNIRRQFRTYSIPGTYTPASPPPFDAKIYGGPWRGQATGVTLDPAHMLTLDQYQLMQNVPEPYNPLKIDSQTAAAVTLNKELLTEATRFVAQGDHPASVELLAVFP